MMPGLFSIPVGGLKEGHHVFEFDINKAFFDQFDESEIKEGELTAVADTTKGKSHIDLIIRISGIVKVCCDRCLGMFDHPVESENRLMISFGSQRDDSDPEVVILPHDENELDLKQYLYEFIHLALPIRKTHPDNADGGTSCDPEMIEKLREHLVDERHSDDPRWEDLKKLMKNN